MRKWLRITGAIAAPAVLLMLATSSAATDGDHPDGRPAAASAALAPPLSRQPSSETSYVSVAPCRVVDTRIGTGTNGTALGNGTQRHYYVRGSAGFSAQGGLAAGCGVPAGATSVSAVLAAVSPSAGGYIKAWAYGQPEPHATALNYFNHIASTGASLSLGAAEGLALTVRNVGGPTHLIVDVTGYYVKPIAGMISDAGVPYAGSSRIVGATQLSTGVYNVQVDRDIHYCTATATAWDASYYASTDTYLGGAYDSIQVRLYDANGAPVNRYFYLTVVC